MGVMRGYQSIRDTVPLPKAQVAIKGEGFARKLATVALRDTIDYHVDSAIYTHSLRQGEAAIPV